MSRSPYRPAGQPLYSSVPQSPRSAYSQQHYRQSQQQRLWHQRNSPLPPTPQPTPSVLQHNARGAMAQGVATGAIGAGYGPYSYHPNPMRDSGIYGQGRFSSSTSPHSSEEKGKEKASTALTTTTIPTYMWDKEPEFDDALHNPDSRRRDNSFTLFSLRGWVNSFALFAVVFGLVTLFAGYPIIVEYNRQTAAKTGFNLGGINGSGQVPDLPGLHTLIDADTPQDAYSRTGHDGKKYHLIFSDEFNQDGRTFYPGDDPYWEAADLHYWPTGDLEWYDPSGAITRNGNLELTITEEPIHDLNFKSGMITGWNKLCFTTGYIEVRLSLPGSPLAPGLWPGVWSMGNLGRAGYGATTEGMWPYSYDTCDLGTFPNQTAKDGTPGTAASEGGSNGGPISYLPGQRVSACTCKGEDHPGPSNTKGRGVPEIDILEAQVDTSVFRGQVSQSYQTAPYNYQYQFNNASPATTIYDADLTTFNHYKGGVYQQAVSAVTYVDEANYGGNGYATYGYEWWSNPSNREEGYITWFSQGQPSWTMTSATVGIDTTTRVSERLIPEEPMYLIINLGMSPGFQKQDYKHLQFPSTMYVDYVRVYQRDGVKASNSLGCDPGGYPTKSYIDNHMNAYTDANLTTWAQAGYTFPKNREYDTC